MLNVTIANVPGAPAPMYIQYAESLIPAELFNFGAAMCDDAEVGVLNGIEENYN